MREDKDANICLPRFDAAYRGYDRGGAIPFAAYRHANFDWPSMFPERVVEQFAGGLSGFRHGMTQVRELMAIAVAFFLAIDREVEMKTRHGWR